MWGAVLISFYVATEVTSHEIQVECHEFYDFPPVDDTPPSVPADLRVELVTVGEKHMMNISWAINIDGSIKYLTGTRISIQGDSDYHCKYNPELPNSSLGESEQKWFHFLVKASYGFNSIQVANLPLHPPESSSYKCTTITIPRITQRQITTTTTTTVTLVSITTAKEKEPVPDKVYFVSIVLVIFGGLGGLMILCSCYIICKYNTHSVVRGLYTMDMSPSYSYWIKICETPARCEDWIIEVLTCIKLRNHKCVKKSPPHLRNRLYKMVSTARKTTNLFFPILSYPPDKSGRASVATLLGFRRVPTCPIACVPVLVVYPAENRAFQRAVVALAEFLQWHGGCSVAVDMWQQRKIAEMGPMRWLAERAKAAHRVLIVCPQIEIPSSKPGDSPHDHAFPEPSIPAAAHDLYLLILNMVASQAKSASDLAKFWVVQLGEQQGKNPCNLALELSACNTFCLMKDLKKLCKNLHTQGQDDEKMSDLNFSEKSTVALKEAVEKLVFREAEPVKSV